MLDTDAKQTAMKAGKSMQRHAPLTHGVMVRISVALPLMLFAAGMTARAQDDAGQRNNEAVAERCADRTATAHSGDPEPDCQLEWQRRIAAEQRRIAALRAERQRNGGRLKPRETEFQFRDILNDDTLRAGDIVILSDRQFIFTGRTDDARSPSDFARVRPDR